MNTLKRLQDWAPRAIGGLLLITPFVFGIMTLGSHSPNAWILGSVVGVVAVALSVFWLGTYGNKVIEMVTVIVGTVLFITSWVLDGIWFVADAWASGIVGLLLVIAVRAVPVKNEGWQVGFATYRPLNMGSIESETA
jgi:hypothetical protein